MVVTGVQQVDSQMVVPNEKKSILFFKFIMICLILMKFNSVNLY